MRIVAHCPNGHRVKVKDHLAGGLGRCPTCGIAFYIESESELPVARLLALDPAVVATLPRARPLGQANAPAPVAAADPPAAPGVDQRGISPAAQQAPAAAPPPPALHESIAERPDLTWCIAFPGGEPTEPLDAQTMQAWLDGGHATGTEVVWRADWPEWRPVQDVFPGFFVGDFRF